MLKKNDLEKMVKEQSRINNGQALTIVALRKKVKKRNENIKSLTEQRDALNRESNSKARTIEHLNEQLKSLQNQINNRRFKKGGGR